MTDILPNPFEHEKNSFSVESRFDAAKHFHNFKSALIGDVPFVPGRDNYCVPASLAMVMEYMTGRKYATGYMARICGTSQQHGTVIRGAELGERFKGKFNGMEICHDSGGPRPFKHVERNIAAGTPVMVVYDEHVYVARPSNGMNHMVVVVGYDRKRWFTLDPEYGRKVMMKNEQLKEAWQGNDYRRFIVRSQHPPEITRAHDKYNRRCEIYKR